MEVMTKALDLEQGIPWCGRLSRVILDENKNGIKAYIIGYNSLFNLSQNADDLIRDPEFIRNFNIFNSKDDKQDKFLKRLFIKLKQNSF